jgi:hypothetical protein
MLGIEKLKQIIDTGLGLADTLRAIFQDGKFKLQEIFLLVGNFTAVSAVVESWPVALQEFKDLDEAERASLNAYFAQKFDIPNDKVEVFIEKALTNVVNLVELYTMMRDLKKPAA